MWDGVATSHARLLRMDISLRESPSEAQGGNRGGASAGGEGVAEGQATGPLCLSGDEKADPGAFEERVQSKKASLVALFLCADSA